MTNVANVEKESETNNTVKRMLTVVPIFLERQQSRMSTNIVYWFDLGSNHWGAKRTHNFTVLFCYGFSVENERNGIDECHAVKKYICWIQPIIANPLWYSSSLTRRARHFFLFCAKKKKYSPDISCMCYYQTMNWKLLTSYALCIYFVDIERCIRIDNGLCL